MEKKVPWVFASKSDESEESDGLGQSDASRDDADAGQVEGDVCPGENL